MHDCTCPPRRSTVCANHHTYPHSRESRVAFVSVSVHPIGPGRFFPLRLFTPNWPRPVLPVAIIYTHEPRSHPSRAFRERLSPALRLRSGARSAMLRCSLLTPMPLTRTKGQLMSASEIDRTLVRLAHEILEKNSDLDRLAFIGIRRRGVPLAQRLARKIESLEQRAVPVGILDINLYRDDLTTVDIKPVVSATEIPFSVQGKDIILMDDVLYTGRTIRAALDALFDHGRPSRVQLLVLIDRGHRELPIEARFIGRKVQTTDVEIIEVKFQEIDGMEKVLLCERAG